MVNWFIHRLCVVEWDGHAVVEDRKSVTTKLGQMGVSSHVSQLNHKITLLRPFVIAQKPFSCSESKLISVQKKAIEENIMVWWLLCRWLPYCPESVFVLFYYGSHTHTTHTHSLSVMNEAGVSLFSTVHLLNNTWINFCLKPMQKMSYVDGVLFTLGWPIPLSKQDAVIPIWKKVQMSCGE